ncbi:tail protein [Mycobacterium phage Marvin]|uniref:Uncharacterized protein n=1 Tax=Mycobacterium phage Marvin TaxID=1034139 RepID=G1BNE5_9CAUD|nr:tail protein [Mycobacterium phage Marvin]AEJ95357.1 hypothetical protein MARVIN_75 [Mycobacterium phage Marvin]
MNTNIVIVGEQRQPVTFGVGVLIVLILVFGVIVTYFWQILAVTMPLLAIVMIRRAAQLERRKREAILSRADEQHQLFLKGDLRGVYGDHHERPES